MTIERCKIDKESIEYLAGLITGRKKERKRTMKIINEFDKKALAVSHRDYKAFLANDIRDLKSKIEKRKS